MSALERTRKSPALGCGAIPKEGKRRIINLLLFHQPFHFQSGCMFTVPKAPHGRYKIIRVHQLEDLLTNNPLRRTVVRLYHLYYFG